MVLLGGSGVGSFGGEDGEMGRKTNLRVPDQIHVCLPPRDNSARLR